MALSTIERQRLRAALNNIELANRVEVMLNYVDVSSDPLSITQFLAPSGGSEVGGLIDAFASVSDGGAISFDIPALSGVTSAGTLAWAMQTDSTGQSLAIDAATGVVTGTAPAFDAAEGAVNSYQCLISASNPYGVKTIGLIVTVTE